MTLKLPDKWLWDFWFVQDGPDYHIFYLQAARSLIDPELRHWNVSIGHAVSSDLRNWTVLPDALRPSPTPAWDDYTTWTGSIIKQAGLWYFFYTGASHRDQGLVQRIGLATSSDLLHWEKHPQNPLIEADPKWYELLDLNLWHDQAWRDPWVFQHPSTGDFHAFITARLNSGLVDGRGVIGHARSTNLIDWEVLPPVSEPGDFGQLEVPQMVQIQGQYYLLFSTSLRTYSVRRLQQTRLVPLTSTHYLRANDPLGPYSYPRDDCLVGDTLGSLYSGKIIQSAEGGWVFLAFRNFDDQGHFIGQLSDPYPVEIDQMGNLMVSWRI